MGYRYNGIASIPVYRLRYTGVLVQAPPVPVKPELSAEHGQSPVVELLGLVADPSFVRLPLRGAEEIPGLIVRPTAVQDSEHLTICEKVKTFIFSMVLADCLSKIRNIQSSSLFSKLS